MDTIDTSKPWYHGSPLELSELMIGSTISQSCELAEVFSHKPEQVCVSDDGTNVTIRHNGNLDGYLYLISEPVHTEDVSPVPGSTMEPGMEWLISRPLQVALIRTTDTTPRGCRDCPRVAQCKR